MIIGLTGQRRAGKSTAAELLVEINPDIVRVAFADALKSSISSQYGMPLEDLYLGPKKEKYRQLMQDFGSQARSIDARVFVRPVMEFIDAHPENHHVIEDVRYGEELQELLQRGGVLIKVFTDAKIRADRGAVPDRDLDNHSSETEVAAVGMETVRALGGHIVYNNSNRNAFKAELSWIYNIISAKQQAAV